jgi:hypothetical protein
MAGRWEGRSRCEGKNFERGLQTGESLGESGNLTVALHAIFFERLNPRKGIAVDHSSLNWRASNNRWFLGKGLSFKRMRRQRGAFENDHARQSFHMEFG